MSSDDATLSVAMIIKNCENTILQTLDSLPWDVIHELVVVDTGSDDQTWQKLKNDGRAKLFHYNDPDPVSVHGKLYLSDFARARNFSFSRCTGDYILWIDAGDILWNPAGFTAYYNDMVRGAKDKVTVFGMQYDYDHDEHGNCIQQYDRERIVQRDTHVWRSPIHEVLCSLFAYSGLKVPAEESRIIHLPKTEEERRFSAERNYLVEEKFIKDNNGNVEPRMWLLHGNSLLALGKNSKAIESYKKYLNGSERIDEKYHVHLHIAECHRKMGHPDRASDSIMKAISLMPSFREAYISMSELMMETQDFGKAIHWAKMALQMKDNNLSYKGNPCYLEARPWEVLYNAYLKDTKLDKALYAVDQVLRVIPGHPQALSDKSIIANLQRQNKAEEAYKTLEDLVVKEGDQGKFDKLQAAIPRSIEDSGLVAAPVASHRRPGQHSIAIFCGESFRFWGHDSIHKGGVGGSETAVIRMSEELSKLGWHVEVYGWPSKEQEGLHNGVWWFPYYRMQNCGHFDVFVAWRSPYPAVKPPIHSRAYCWLHDIQYPEHWCNDALGLYDFIIPLSEAHRKNVSFIPDEKIWISRNGLDSSFWSIDSEKIQRDPHKLVYASCPSRGLHIILDNWDNIRSLFPKANIDIFYGFTHWYKEAMKRNQRFVDIYNMVMESINKPGINFHGMVDQKRLSRAFFEAGVWAYPCPFPEISCITAIQAQACGAIPVTTGYWALSETVEYGHVVSDTETNIESDKEVKKDWLETLLRVMGDEQEQEQTRLQMMPAIRTKCGWDKVAQDWSDKFKRDLAAGRPTSSPKLVMSA